MTRFRRKIHIFPLSKYQVFTVSSRRFELIGVNTFLHSIVIVTILKYGIDINEISKYESKVFYDLSGWSKISR